MPATDQDNLPVYVGCAGWSIPGAAAAAFPAEGSHLERYAQVFPAVEINSSFYRPHQPATYARWRAGTPPHFRFSVKLPRSITHTQRLKNPETLLDRFLGEAGQLQEKLGCILVQLPPSLRFDAITAQAFFIALRARTEVPVACEPRHATWFTAEAANLMAAFRISCVQADPAPVAGAVPAGYPSPFYLRLHGSPVMYRSAYPQAFLDQVANQIRHHSAGGLMTWCIFDNTQDFAAVPDGLFLLSRVASPGDPDADAQAITPHIDLPAGQ